MILGDARLLHLLQPSNQSLPPPKTQIDSHVGHTVACSALEGCLGCSAGIASCCVCFVPGLMLDLVGSKFFVRGFGFCGRSVSRVSWSVGTKVCVFMLLPDSAISPPTLTSCSSHTEVCDALGATDGITSLTTITCTLTTTEFTL